MTRQSEVWTVADLRNLLAALSLSVRQDGSEYAVGYRAALVALSVALGLRIESPTGGEGFRW